jgi:ABC-type nitrate/sulfonate/bicarbonate transport system permease component
MDSQSHPGSQSRGSVQMPRFLLDIIAVVLIFVVWQAVATLAWLIKGVTFPGPIKVMHKLSGLLRGERLYEFTFYSHLLLSLVRWLSGYLLAVVAGVLTGLLLGASRTIYRLFYPLIYVIGLIPGLAWIPISLLLFGIGNVSTVFMIFIIAFTPVVINTASAIRTTPEIYVRVARMMGAGSIRIFFQVLLPQSLIPIINGLRTGMANAWRVLIAAEMIVGIGVGLGYVIIQSRWSLDYEAAFVSIFIICLLGLIVEHGLFIVVEKKLLARLGFLEKERVL